MCVVLFGPESHDFLSWLTLELSAGLQNTRQCICRDWKTLENQSANLQANPGLEGISSKLFFCLEEGLKMNSNCSFIVYGYDPFQLLSVNFF